MFQFFNLFTLHHNSFDNQGSEINKNDIFDIFLRFDILSFTKITLKDIDDFLEMLKYLGDIPSNATLVTVDVADLYPSIPHSNSLQALYEKLEERTKN